MQADLRVCWSHIPYCWKSHVTAQISVKVSSAWPYMGLCLRDFWQSKTQTSLLRYREIENLLVASLDMIRSKNRTTIALISLCGCAGWSASLLFANPEDSFFSRRGLRITKALISLPGCAGWSAPLLFTNPEDRFSRVEVQIYHKANLSFRVCGTNQFFCDIFLPFSGQNGLYVRFEYDADFYRLETILTLWKHETPIQGFW